MVPYSHLLLLGKKKKANHKQECYHLWRAVLTQYSVWLCKHKGQVICKSFGPLPFSQLITVSRLIASADASGSVGTSGVVWVFREQVPPGAGVQGEGPSGRFGHLSGDSEVSGYERGTTLGLGLEK